MKKAVRLAVVVCLTLCSLPSLKARITGTVFRDFNANGVKGYTATFNKPFASGITVNVYNRHESAKASKRALPGSDHKCHHADCGVGANFAIAKFGFNLKKGWFSLKEAFGNNTRLKSQFFCMKN